MSDSECSQQNKAKIIYIVSPDFNSPHITDLARAFNQYKIPLKFQKDQDTLGVQLDRRYFVVVDNMSGKISLGPWFSSLLLFIVGYPKIGSNKKNHYCTKPNNVIEKYYQFCEMPEFAKRNYLSSAVSQKSMFKTSKSLHPKIVSSNSSSKILPKPTLTKNLLVYNAAFNINQQSKLFLYLSKNNFTYNKWIMKIAANNQKKFQIVENIQNLLLTLSVCRTQDNFVITNDEEFHLISSKAIKGLQILIYTQNLENIKIKQDVLRICKDRYEIINTIRQIGFQVVSLRDIDKSIVKYGNPCANQLKMKSNKRINWEKQQDSKQTIQEIQNIKSKASAPNLQTRINQDSSYPTTNPVIKVCSMQQKQSTESLKTGSIIKNICTMSKGIQQIQRLSIQSTTSNVCKLEPPKNSDLQLTKINQIIISHSQKKQIIQNVPIVQSTPKPTKPIKKVKKIKNNNKNHTKTEPNQKQNEFKQKQQVLKRSKICKLQYIEPEVQNFNVYFTGEKFLSTIENKFSQMDFLNTQSFCSQDIMSKNNQNAPLKLSLVNKNNSFIEKTPKFQKQSKQTKNISLQNSDSAFKQNINSFHKTKIQVDFEKPLLYSNHNLINNIGLQNNSQFAKQITTDNFLLLCKDFNFKIQNTRNQIIDKIGHKNIQNQSFYSPTQLNEKMNHSNIKYLIILMDQLQIESYLSVLRKYLKSITIISIYVFQKSDRLQIPFIKYIKQILKYEPFCSFKQILKLILQNEYFQEGFKTAKQIIALLS